MPGHSPHAVPMLFEWWARRLRACQCQRTHLPGRLLVGKRIAAWGAAFKPGPDDARDSLGLDIACRLHDLGAHVTVYDRWPWEMRWRYLSSSPTPTRRWKQPGDADAILVATAWPEFAGISPSTAKAAGVSMTVVDACQDINDNTVREAAGSAISHKQAGRGDPAAALVSLRTAAVDPAMASSRIQVTPSRTGVRRGSLGWLRGVPVGTEATGPSSPSIHDRIAGHLCASAMEPLPGDQGGTRSWSRTARRPPSPRPEEIDNSYHAKYLSSI